MKTEILEILQNKITKLYIIYMLVVFPLYYHNNYIDIMEAKRLVYIWGTAAYVLVMTAFTIACHGRVRWQFHHYVLLLFAGAGLMALPGCPDLVNSVMGYGAKCTGLLLYLLGFAAICYIVRHGEWSTGMTWAMLFTGTVVGILQILNRWGIDPLHMYENLAEEDISIFVSTIGQVNYNAAYDCIMLGVLLIWYITCKERVSQIIYGFCSVILLAGAMSCCSNSAYVTILGICYVIFGLTSRHVEYAARVATLPLLLEAAAYLIWGLYNSKNVYLWDSTEMIYNARLHLFVTFLAILFALGCGVCYWMHRHKKEIAARVWRMYMILVTIGIPLGGAFTIYQYTNHYNIKAQILWSSYRMDIWKHCLTLIRKEDWWHKLFGWGFNCVYQALGTIGRDDIAGVPIMDAHNLLLNTLITSGIIGTLLWMVLLVYMLRKAKKISYPNTQGWVIVCGIVTYLVQGIFNGPQILTTPVFLLLLGVYMQRITSVNKTKACNL